MGKLTEPLAEIFERDVDRPGNRAALKLFGHADIEQHLVGVGLGDVADVAKPHVAVEHVAGHEAGVVDRVLGRPVRGSVGQLLFGQVVDRQSGADRHGDNVDPLVDSSGPHRLGAEDLPVRRVEQELETDLRGPGIVAGVAGRVDKHLLVLRAGPLERLLAHSGHADGQVEHLADGRALGAGVDAGAAEGVVGRDPSLSVGRPGQGNQGLSAAHQVRDLDGVADGVDGGIAGTHVGIDDDSAGGPDLESRLPSEPRLGSHAHGQNHQPAGDRFARAEDHAQRFPLLLDCRDRGAQTKVDAVQLQLLVDGSDHFRVGGDEDLFLEFDERDPQVPASKRLGHFQPDVAAADHHGMAGRMLVDGGDYGVHVLEVSKGQNTRAIGARYGRAHGRRSRAEDQYVVRLGVVFVRLEIAHGHLARLPVDAQDFRIRPYVDAVTLPHALGCFYEQAFSLLDGAADVVGEAAIGKGDVGTAFEHHDFRVFR